MHPLLGQLGPLARSLRVALRRGRSVRPYGGQVRARGVSRCRKKDISESLLADMIYN